MCDKVLERMGDLIVVDEEEEEEVVEDEEEESSSDEEENPATVPMEEEEEVDEESSSDEDEEDETSSTSSEEEEEEIEEGADEAESSSGETEAGMEEEDSSSANGRLLLKSRKSATKVKKRVLSGDEVFGNRLRAKVEQLYHEDLLQYVRQMTRKEILSNEDTQQLAGLIQMNADQVPQDPFHRSVPVLTKFEISSILKYRVAELQYDPLTYLRDEEGEFVQLPHIQPYLIAQEELRRKVLPIIVMRPFNNGRMHEAWRVADLQILQHLEIDTMQLSLKPPETMSFAEQLHALVT